MWKVLTGDAVARLSDISEGSFQTCITSPPYWGLRDYEVEDQLGLEATYQEYVRKLVIVGRSIRRVLKDDATLWLVLGDSYNGSGGAGGDYNKGGKREGQPRYPGRNAKDLKPKDLVGVPWRVAFAFQDDGWWLRSCIIWHKPSMMPENVKDRPTLDYEFVFLFSKSLHYYYDQDAIREPITTKVQRRLSYKPKGDSYAPHMDPKMALRYDNVPAGHPLGRNKRSVWSIPTANCREAHFAVFPEKLVEPMVLAGSAKGDEVLDPFCGRGTTGIVSLRHNRKFTGIDLNPKYVEMTEKNLKQVTPDIFSSLEF